MIVATTPYIAGHRVVETKGEVFGLVVRSRGFSGNLLAGLRSLGGGEISSRPGCRRSTGSSGARRRPAGTRSSPCASTARRWPAR
jgi:hypothetical protein